MAGFHNNMELAHIAGSPFGIAGSPFGRQQHTQPQRVYDHEVDDDDDNLVGKIFEIEIDGKSHVVKFSQRLDDEAYQSRQATFQDLLDNETVDAGAAFPDSTNLWLFIHGGESDVINKLIALLVLVLQVTAYLVMAWLLILHSRGEDQFRRSTCYGAYCNSEEAEEQTCMNLTTGGLTSVLLVGFLWSDVVNVVYLLMHRKLVRLLPSIAVCLELGTAIVCGFLVGLYSESDFDAMGGAVGILFVHDLDEKVFASVSQLHGMKRGAIWKIFALCLWVVVSVGISVLLACRYDTGSIVTGNCLEGEFECNNGECIWYGFVCNGIADCVDGSDEVESSTAYDCNFALSITCPNDTFLCLEDGSCIDASKRCDGNLDCPLGWDEHREQNCRGEIAAKQCGGQESFEILPKYEDDTWHQKWTGQFKCDSGQCINASYACDGIVDCLDGSDEYPLFQRPDERPFETACPYTRLIECDVGEVLCKEEGKCISQRSLCDGYEDCSDASDEFCLENSAYSENAGSNCTEQLLAGTHFMCGGPVALLNDQNFTLFLETIYSTPSSSRKDFPRDMLHLYLNDTDAARTCIPIQYRCDGMPDCDDQSDEFDCYLYDCPDGTTACFEDQALRSCVPREWLCDSVGDCLFYIKWLEPDWGLHDLFISEDENDDFCLLNGGTTNGGHSGCEHDDEYQCIVFPDKCIASSQMCDGIQDCPKHDDETNETCAIFEATLAGSLGGVLECNTQKEGPAFLNHVQRFTFVLPDEYEAVRISTCLPTNDVWTDIMMYPSDYQLYANSTNHALSTIFEANDDHLCSCDRARNLVANASTTYAPILHNTNYIVSFRTRWEGHFALSVECRTESYDKISKSEATTYNKSDPIKQNCGNS